MVNFRQIAYSKIRQNFLLLLFVFYFPVCWSQTGKTFHSYNKKYNAEELRTATSLSLFLIDQTFIDYLGTCENIEELYLTLVWADYAFEALGNLKKLKILSIVYYNDEDGEEHGMAAGGDVLDLKFLSQLENLELLYMPGNGEVDHELSVLSLKKLRFCRLPASAFNPQFFVRQNSILHLSFGEEKELNFLKYKAKAGPIFHLGKIPTVDQMSMKNKDYRRLRMTQLSWKDDSQKVFNNIEERSDSIFYLSDIHLPIVKWWFKADDVYVFEGEQTAIEDDIQTMRKLNIPFFERTFKTWSTDSSVLTYKYSGDFARHNDYTESHRKNGRLHGKVIKIDQDRYSESRFADGMLTYRCPCFFKASAPNIDPPIEIKGQTVKECYYDESGLYLVNIYRGDTITKPAFIFSLKNGKIDGQIIELSDSGDTLLSCTYHNGILNGRFYRKLTLPYRDTVVQLANYVDGAVVGEEVEIQKNYTVTSISENGRKFITARRNKNNSIIFVDKWNTTLVKYERSYYGTDGKIVGKITFDEDRHLLHIEEYRKDFKQVSYETHL